MFAKVVVDVRSSNVDVMYTYKIPDEFQDYIFIGSRVLIDFNLRKILGYVIEISDNTDYQGTIKEIIDVLDFEKELTKEQVELALYLKNDTKSLLVSCLELMYPSFLKNKYRKYIIINNYDNLDAEIAILFGNRKKILIENELLKSFPKIKKEIEKGNLEIAYDNYSYGKRKKTKFYSLNDNINYEGLSSKRIECIKYLQNNPNSKYFDLKRNISCSEFILKDMIKLGYIKVKEKFEIYINENNIVYKPKIEYNFIQKEVKEKYKRLSNKPFLLFSNDESFKMNFYLDIVYENITDGKQAMIVCPTILNCLEVLKFFEKNLIGARICDFSSILTNAEYYTNYINVKWQNVDLVITTKVGIFMPLEKLGLIIMIDEGNQYYINEQNPKFDTKEVLMIRSQIHDAKLILSSTSPSIDSYYNYFINKYILLNYNIKMDNNISLINMRDEIGNTDLMISRKLELEINNMINKNKISLLILNFKGYSTTLICKECGEVVKCPNCNIPLSFSKEKGYAKCGYCDYKKEIFVCDKCKSVVIEKYGYGLEKLEEELHKKFPDARILKIDSDMFSNKTNYLDAVLTVEENNVDIIIGTNLLNNLISDADLGLVATINADNVLNFNDYRSSEILFNQISNTINHKDCINIIQGYKLDHYSIINAINNDYDKFFETEINFRRSLNYPPLIEISRLIITGTYKEMWHCAYYFKKIYKSIFKDDSETLGPVYLPRFKGIQLIIKYHDFNKVSKLIDEVAKKFADEKIIINFDKYPKSFS